MTVNNKNSSSSMNKFILHHYNYSPYSEKVRRMLSYAGIDWQSAIHKEMPPRPVLAELAGGYARIPVAQIGAEIYCDSNLIAEEIAVLGNKPELSLFNASQEVKDFVEHVEGKIFFAGVLSGGTAKLRKKIRQEMSLWDIFRFFIDRMMMGLKATTPNMIKITEAKKIINDHLEDMESRLKHDFIFGDKPNIADFSAFHSLWFMRDIGECHFMADYPKVCAWMDRMNAFALSKVTDLPANDALKIASDSTPQHTTRADSKNITIAPNDYRQVETKGKLVFEDNVRWVLRRETSKAGAVNVHFPKLAYQLAE